MSTPVYAYLPLVVLAIAIARNVFTKSPRPLPPGPKPFPIIGNLLQFPQQRPWLTFKKWKEQYGDLVYVNVLGRPTVILNTRKACIDLLDKRSGLYSDRPRLIMLVELMGFDWDMPFMRYSARWRHYRRLFQQYFNEKASKNYLPIQERTGHNLLRRLLQDPDKFLKHIRLSFGESTLHAVYDIKVKGADDMYINLIEKSMTLASDAIIPGRFLVDLLPFLKYVPSWFPGAGFKKFAKLVKELGDASKDMPANYTMKRSTDGGPPCSTIFTEMLERCEQEDLSSKLGEKNTDIAKNTAALAYTAGSDTTVSAIQGFFFAIANFPDVQIAAQKELDAVVGRDRLPTFDDMKDLPYIDAIVKEVLRWHSVVPAGVAHRLTEDDVYEGYLIPKGTIVMPNQWIILHDPEVYPDPHSFNPSRWLINTPEGLKTNEAVPDPYIAFGYGRRICPGRYFAMNSLFITIAHVLSCFNTTSVDDSGKPAGRTPAPEDFTDGLLIYPKPFKASLTPRSENVMRLLEELGD